MTQPEAAFDELNRAMVGLDLAVDPNSHKLVVTGGAPANALWLPLPPIQRLQQLLEPCHETLLRFGGEG